MEFEICSCCGKPKRPKGVLHPSPTCTSALLDAQSGESVSKPHKGGLLTGPNSHEGWKRPSHKDGYLSDAPYNDSGGASRFFFRVAETLEDAELVRYCAKASRRERDAGLEGMALKQYSHDGRKKHIENPYQRNDSVAHNSHPTVKPLSLCKYLATLLLPPAEYAPRRLFVPFAGVASECIGAMQAGWEHVEGVELTEEYMPIAQARVEYWTEKQAEEQQQPPLFIPERMEEKAEQATLL